VTVPGECPEPRRPSPLIESLVLLQRTPRTLADWLVDLPSELVDRNEGPGTFSASDVLAHLIQGEVEDWMPRVRMLLSAGEAQTFRPFDPEGFRGEPRRPLDERLEDFARLRSENLAELERLRLNRDDLDRRGRHPEFGVVSLGQLLSTWVVHDLAHLGQVTRLLSKAMAPEIGPWRAYFSTLREI